MSKITKTIDRFYTNQDLRFKFVKFFDNKEDVNMSKYLFTKLWKFKIHSQDLLIDFFDNLGIKIGITPTKCGNFWSAKIYTEQEITICNDYYSRKDAVEYSVIKALDIYEK